ncbi:hypothetical protein K2X89_12245 [Myxococcota bacterium]|nr:hypothetical protein [Myxococcota bacterium]
MTAYHSLHAMHARSPQASSMPAGSLALWACDATRGSTPAFIRGSVCSDTKRRDEKKREVDSMAEVNGS